ncbi:MAG: 23S rRNA (guanosine(2251)-2'-O)-methyltransferase RlmB [Rickettsiaceae bacterium]|nr:MAG: 23S rRNA (guanosine(2251)-2'-O)-methyltransferase RlmB [Rickettsiaceae bacterium]
MVYKDLKHCELNDNKLKLKNSDSYLMYGKHAVIAALNNPQRKIIKIFCTESCLKANRNLIHVDYNDKIEIVDNQFLNKALGQNQNHQGISVKLSSIFAYNLQNLEIIGENYKVAVLDQITDPQNIGSIIRSAVAFGIKAIIMPQDNSPTENAIIAKIASGALELIKIFKVPNLKAAIEFFKKKNFWVFGFDSAQKNILNSKMLVGRIVLVLGSEDKGLRRLTKEACDYLVKIPMTPNVESLNVANAASIIFHASYSISNIDEK